MRRVLRQPLLHFLLGGAALFVLVRGTAARRETLPAPVVITAEDVARLRRDHARDTGRDPSPSDEAGLVERAVEDELLFREALSRGLDQDRSVRNWLVEQMRVLEPDTRLDDEQLHARARALGLDRTDLVVRRMLVQKMRLLAARTGERPPSDDELRAFYAAHAAEYRTPERVTLWQVFLADAAPERGERLLTELRRDAVPPEEAVRRGDAFAAPARLRSQSPADLARRFGPGFADALAGARVGEWTGPVSTVYGTHLVWIEARVPGGAPALHDLRGQLRERWLEEQRARRLADMLRSLRERAPLHVESAAWHDRSRS
jgi:peptidyl-prolyl cis-trans isomerase C